MTYRRKYLILIITVAVLGSFAYWQFQKPKSFEIIGNVKKIEAGRIFIEGNYLIQKTGEPKLEAVQFEISVSDATVITRSAFVIPKTGGMFNPQELPRQESQVSLDDMAQDVKGQYKISLMAKSGKDIYGRTQFEAINITYNVPIF